VVRPTYLDCNATTPVDPRVQAVVQRYIAEEFGNSGSRTHEYGAHAKQAVESARDRVGALIGVNREHVVFTSGATESNNLAILGLAPHGEETKRRHIISTAIEHKAILEPLQCLQRRGFEVTLLPCTEGGWIDPESLRSALRPDTLLVSVMHVNNETGVIQDIPALAGVLGDHAAYFHVDAAQSFGKGVPGLELARVDLVSASAHKVYGPKGVGALVMRARGFKRVPLQPLMFGGGQEKGLRPGTLPVPLIAGFGLACELAREELADRTKACNAIRRDAMKTLNSIGATFNGDPERTVPHTLNVSFPGVDSEALMVALKDHMAMSNGSACTSSSYVPSHVLTAMGLPRERIDSAVRLSWCHETGRVDWRPFAQAVRSLQ
jgi:cysteine desulfurase